MADEKTIIVSQKEDESFALDHSGGVALYGDKQQSPLQHQFAGQVVHTTLPQQPLVHLVCWGEEEPCEVTVTGRVTLVGDKEVPLQVKMSHYFENDHRQTHIVEPLDHTVHMDTLLAKPIHHALQMRTPLQLRFCNTWQIASDYRVEINLGNSRVISVRLTGATVATPQPCEDEPCPPPATPPSTP